MNWRKPRIILYNTDELICKIKAKANSTVGPTCESVYTDKYACPELSVGETWGDEGNEGVGIGCGIISQCIEVGPLNGCIENIACSTSIMPVFR